MWLLTGPVGSGKTSIIEGLTWGPWGESRAPTLDELIRDGTEQCSVQIDVEVDGVPLTITRSKARGRDATLSLAVDGKPIGNGLGTAPTSRETQGEVQKRIGVSYAALCAGPFALQNTKNLMDAAPRDRKNLLMDLLLDQSQWAEWAEMFKTRAATAKAVLNEGAVQLSRLTAVDLDERMTEARARVALMEGAVADHEAEAERLSGEWRALSEKLGEAKARAARAIEVARQLEEARRQWTSAKEKHTAAEAAVQSALTILQSLTEMPFEIVSEGHVAAAIEEAANLRAEHLALSTRKSHAQSLLAAAQQVKPIACPNCGEVFSPGVDQDAVTAAENELGLVGAVIGEAQSRALAADQAAKKLRSDRLTWLDWDRRRVDAQSAIDRARASEAEALAALPALAENGKRLLAESKELAGEAEALTAIEAQSADVGHRRDVAKSNADAARVTKREADLAVGAITRDIETRDRLAAESEGLRVEVETYSRLAQACGRDGVPTMMLESALGRIEEYANDVLGRMPGDFSVRLVTQKATQKGTASDTLDIVVDPGTGTPRSYAMLSGGQQFRVDLAVRMAITSVLSGHHIGTLVVDESFDRWQDEEGRRAVLDTLASIAPEFQRILVITHHPDVIESLERLGARRIELSQDVEGVAHAT